MAPAMPYMPYWFESFAEWFPWIIPAVAISGLWIAKLCEDQRLRGIAQRTYFAAMLVVAWGTLRTIVADEGCWLLHTGSLCVMILGAVFPNGEHERDHDMVLTEH
jgi:hypothetical protein